MREKRPGQLARVRADDGGSLYFTRFELTNVKLNQLVLEFGVRVEEKHMHIIREEASQHSHAFNFGKTLLTNEKLCWEELSPYLRLSD